MIALLVIAVIVALVLWTTTGTSGDDTDTFVPVTTANSTDPSTATDPGGPISVLGSTSFDPGDPDGAVENPDATGLALDGDATTVWNTVCYNDRYFNGKPGVGLVIQLSAPSTGVATIDIASGPYIVEVFASAAETAPTSVDGWGTRIGAREFAGEPGRIITDVSAAPARFLLILLREAGRGNDNGCSDNFPFRGSISEVTFVAG